MMRTLRQVRIDLLIAHHDEDELEDDLESEAGKPEPNDSRMSELRHALHRIDQLKAAGSYEAERQRLSAEGRDELSNILRETPIKIAAMEITNETNVIETLNRIGFAMNSADAETAERLELLWN